MNDSIVMRTALEDDGIRYQVVLTSEPRLVLWERFVKFGRHTAERAGGARFREAAGEQERARRFFAAHTAPRTALWK